MFAIYECLDELFFLFFFYCSIDFFSIGGVLLDHVWCFFPFPSFVQFVLFADHSFNFGVAPWFSSGLPGCFLVSLDFLLNYMLEVGKVVLCCGRLVLCGLRLHFFKDFVLIAFIVVSR